MRSADRRGTSTRIPSSPKDSSAAHTAGQRAQMQAGLRILARIIVRAHLRRQASGATPAPPPDQGGRRRRLTKEETSS